MTKQTMNTAKISVIIPVYNVEKYLRRCIDSVLAQDYDNLEIILVNDGSTDESPNICDQYAIRYKNIKVIHKKNGGLSDARNIGIDLASGKYIMFIDSDDFVSSKIISFLYADIIAYSADISTCAFVLFEDEDNIRSIRMVDNTRIICTSVEGLNEMLYQRLVTNSACCKLYDADLFNNVRFPVGEKYEDLATTYKLFMKAKKIIINSQIHYYYFKRPGSIMHVDFDESRMKGLLFAQVQLKAVQQYDSSLTAAAINRLFAEALFIGVSIPDGKKYQKNVATCWRTIKQYRKTVLTDKSSIKSYRLFALVSYFGYSPMIKLVKARWGYE